MHISRLIARELPGSNNQGLRAILRSAIENAPASYSAEQVAAGVCGTVALSVWGRLTVENICRRALDPQGGITR